MNDKQRTDKFRFLIKETRAQLKAVKLSSRNVFECPSINAMIDVRATFYLIAMIVLRQQKRSQSEIKIIYLKIETTNCCLTMEENSTL